MRQQIVAIIMKKSTTPGNSAFYEVFPNGGISLLFLIADGVVVLFL